jgi:hypothetical protein
MKTEDTLAQIDNLLDDVDALIQQLYLNPAVKKQLSAKVYALWTEIEDVVDLTPTDWES